MVYVVTCIPIARQRLCKRIPANMQATSGLLLLGNGAVNMLSQQQKQQCFYVVRATHSNTLHVFSVGPCRFYITSL